MPSAHTVMAVVGATCMCMVAPVAWPLWWGWALLLAWSRVYLGMHYLGDVLVGALLGAVISLAIAYPAMSWAL
jgi:undecaprenyl-diphosphatase